LVNINGVITIPKAFQLKHVESNAAAGDIALSSNEMKLISKAKI
jgi:diketogulonate reductase-like aldo/keto reductase